MKELNILEKESTLYEDSLPRISDYIDNKEFSNAVHEYNKRRRAAVEEGNPIPRVSDYIGNCFILIAEGMARRPNFNRYTYKEEMMGDGIENCLRYIGNYDIEKETRTGKPNAFYYFSRITYWAFVRRIKDEKRKQETKEAMFYDTNIDFFVSSESDSDSGNQETAQYRNDSMNRKMNQ